MRGGLLRMQFKLACQITRFRDNEQGKGRKELFLNLKPSLPRYKEKCGKDVVIGRFPSFKSGGWVYGGWEVHSNHHFFPSIFLCFLNTFSTFLLPLGILRESLFCSPQGGLPL